jgi:hypothetical protein
MSDVPSPGQVSTIQKTTPNLSFGCKMRVWNGRAAPTPFPTDALRRGITDTRTSVCIGCLKEQ